MHWVGRLIVKIVVAVSGLRAELPLGQIGNRMLSAKQLRNSISKVEKRCFQIAISKHVSYEKISAFTGKLNYATGQMLRMAGFQNCYWVVAKSEFHSVRSRKGVGS